MTKLKTKKKMNKSTIAIIIMAFIMVAMVAFGGTYAYFTATSAARSSDFKVGRVALKSSATFTAVNNNVVPGDTILNEAKVSYINESNVDTYIAVVFDVIYSGNYYVCTTASNGETGTDRTEAVWEMRQTARPLNLDAAQIREAFGDAFDINASGAIIDKDVWGQGDSVVGSYDYRNIYMLKDADASTSYKIDAPIETDGSMKPADDRTVEFVDGTAKILTSLNRRFQEVIVYNTSDVEVATKTVMEIPSKKDASTEWAVGDVYLAWEDADISIQFTAYQIQADHIDTTNPEAPTHMQDSANIKAIWDQMKAKVNYTGTITYVKDASVVGTDYTVVAADNAIVTAGGVNQPFYVIK